MNIVQPQIRKLHSLSVNTGNVVLKTIDAGKLVPINDAQHRDDYRSNTVGKLIAIVAMLCMISYLVWNLG